MSHPAPRDARDLAAFGYRQRLHRSLGGFSSFAASFSYISILTGLFQMFYLGYGAGGPAFFWTWPAVFLGQFLVALCFAELAAHYPLCGGIYQWSKQTGSGAAGWLAGWIYLAGSVISLAAVALALQASLPQIDPAFQLIGDVRNKADCARNAVVLGCALIAATTVVNVIGVGALARVNNVGVMAELIGAVTLIVWLSCKAKRGPSVVFERLGHGDGQPLGYGGAFVAAALTALYVLYGFDTAGSLAEETDDPRRRAPRAILSALGAAAVVGALLMLCGMMAVSDLRAPQLSQVSGGLAFIVKDVLGARLGTVFLCVVVVAVSACALAVHSAAVRLVFAMARDNMLPCSAALARVWGRSQTPVLPTLVIGFLAAAVLLVNIDFPLVFEVVTSVAVVWANLAYLFVTVPLLSKRLRGWPAAADDAGKGLFRLGKWGLPIHLAAVAWGVLVVLNVGWPRAAIYGDAWHQRFSALLFTSAILGVGLGYYTFARRGRSVILQEHRA